MARTELNRKSTLPLPPALEGGPPVDADDLPDPDEPESAPLRAGVDRLPPPELEYAELPELDGNGKPRNDRQGNPLYRRVCTNYPIALYALECPRGPSGETMPNIRIVNSPEEYAQAEDDGFAQLHELVPDPVDIRGRSMMRDPMTAKAIHKKRKAILDLGREPDALPDATVTAAQQLVKGLAKLAQS